MKYNKIALICLYILFTFTACSNEYDSLTDVNDYIKFEAISTETKGIPLGMGNTIGSIGVFGYNTGDGDGADQKWNDNRKPDFINNLEVTSDRNYKWTPKKNFKWPKKLKANVSFFAYSPFSNTKSGIAVNTNNIVGIPKITYTVPTTCENQPDLLVSQMIKDLRPSENKSKSVRFMMRHALTSIGFNGTGVGLIQKLTITGVATTGTLTTDEYGNATWSGLSGSSSLDVKNDGQVVLGTERKALNTGDGFLMMIPQVLQPGAQLTVTLVGGKTITFPLSGEWTAGKKIYYDINLFDLKLENGYTIPNTFVGAFWKSNQIGERIIRIPFGQIPNAKTNGRWKAFVLWKDAQWEEDDILFSTSPSTDTGITWDSKTEHPMDMNTYDLKNIVDGSSYTGIGIMNRANPILFRMGLKTQYKPTADKPARYAVVALVYEQNNKFNYHFIYIRQGEEADYIMRTNESGNEFSDMPNRPKAKKFAAYNLTGPIDTKLNINRATFTSYPSQSGALFQWANYNNKIKIQLGNYKNYVFKPYEFNYPYWPTDVTLTKKSSESYWYYYGRDFNISPINYKRPQDGDTKKNVIENNLYNNADESYDVNSEISASNSEFKQSLMAKVNTETDNAVFGYYADGFFDRRAIDPNNCVAAGTPQIASIGKLFYNPATYASIFLPAAGYREGEKGELNFRGTRARYWSSCSYLSIEGMHRALNLEVTSDKAHFQLSYRSSACNIRCVIGKESFYKRDD